MGYDLCRFDDNSVDEELICCICREVLQDPVQAQECEHAFCIVCIQGWLNEHQTCPVDRKTLQQSDLRPPSRILRNIHKKLKIKCDNESFGCTHVTMLELLPVHLNDCSFNPKRPVPCNKGCGVNIPMDEADTHNCVQELRKSMTSHIESLEKKLDECYAEIRVLREGSNQHTPLTDPVAPVQQGGQQANAAPRPHNLSDEEVRWCQSLDEGRVRRWGGMISTPDTVLQNVIRRSLQDSGCPQRLLTELMDRAHERRWPPGLNNLEMRQVGQVNRVCYEQYVTRRVPSRQAVVVLAFENQHMDETFIKSPGMVLIFAHGVD